MKYIDADLLRKEIEFSKYVYSNPKRVVHGIADAFRQDGRAAMCDDILKKIDSLQQEQPEYGYLSTEYIHGKKSRWNVGDVLAYYISTSNEEGEYLLGKIVNVEFDEEEGWVYTFEDERVWDEQTLVEEGAYKKN